MKRIVFAFAVAAAGCSGSPSPPVPVAPPSASDGHPHGHSHERDKMLLADAGKYHAALTAHLSAKDGNELDVFFETAADPKPVALPLASFTATARRTGDDAAHDLTFEPAPADERPKGEPAGACSHFVAKAAWMQPDDDLTVTAEVEIDGKPRRIAWKKFTPRKYAHHVE